jgi:hypothetical protein
MSETEKRMLNPDPADIAATLGGIALTPWPTTAAERIAAYASFGLSEGEELEPDETGLELATMQSPGVPFITASAFRGEFLGLTMHLWADPNPGFADTILGYEELARHLERRFGHPEDVGGDETFPALQWTIGPLTLELYAFTAVDSAVMVGLEHSARSRAFEEA